ncbi:MAG: hypothetical protein GQ534_03065 [Candidatus Delongbacteria bacterium]|nr:hypothetical protein [Candidatus Delongbacteria bacterium]
MIILYIITAILLLVSFFKSPQKTKMALKKAWKKFSKIVLPFLIMLMLVSIVFFLVPEDVIMKYMNDESKWFSIFLATMFGSISVLPGFVAYPLSGLLLEKGLSYMAISAFTTTLMMVGIITFPIEKAYLGVKVTILRNIISLFIALITAVATGLIYGEIL